VRSSPSVRFTRAVCAIAVVAAVSPVAADRTSEAIHRPAPQSAAVAMRSAALQLPMRFEPGRDGGEAAADFVARGPHYAVALDARHAAITLAPPAGDGRPPRSLSMRLVGAAAGAAVEALEPLPGVANYLVGNDPRSWRTGVSAFASVRYHNVYAGVDILYYGNQRRLEYDFVVAAGARPEQIAIAFDGADRVAVEADGTLAIGIGDTELRQPAPIVYQEHGAERRTIAAAFTVDRSRHVRFRVAAYDRTRPLVIDPVLAYASFFGGSAGDAAMGVAADAAGNMYVAGETASLDLPRPAGATAAFGGGSLDAFVAKFSAAGDQLVYATYFGGNNYEYAKDIAVDAAGNAYVAGTTLSSNFPTVHALRASASGAEGFVVKLDPAGAIVYSTYLGGANSDYLYGLAVDASGRAWVTGFTASNDFPVIGAPPMTRTAPMWKTIDGGRTWTPLVSLKTGNAGAVAVDPRNPSVVYAGYEAGVARSADGGQTWAYTEGLPVQITALAVDTATASTVYAGSELFPLRSRDSGATWTVGPPALVTSLAIDPLSPATVYAGTWQGSNSFGVMKTTDGGNHWVNVGMGTTILSLGLSPSSPSTIYAGGQFGIFKTINGAADRWLIASGGIKNAVHALAVDPVDASIAYAGTDAGLFKTTDGGTQWTKVPALPAGRFSSVVVAPSARNVVYVGSGDGGVAVSTDAGATWTIGDLRVPAGALAVDPFVPTTAYAGSVRGSNAFVARVSADGGALDYSTMLGGSGFQYGNAIAVDEHGSAYVVGATDSADFPVVNALQPKFGGTRDLFVVKIAADGTVAYSTYLGGSAWEDGGTIAVDAAGRAHVAGYTLSNDFPTAHAYQPTAGGANDAFVAALTPAGDAFVYSTYLGGTGSEMGPGAYTVGRDPVVAIAVTPGGDAYVVGATASRDFPTLRAVQPAYGGGDFDAFAAQFSADGLLQWSTFVGGAAGDLAKRIAIGADGAVVVAGVTGSANFPAPRAMQPSNAGGDDVFVARLDEDAHDPTPPTTAIAPSGMAGHDGWFRSAVAVGLAGSDPAGESGVAFIDYQVNDQQFERYRTPFSIAAEGTTRVAARATDNSGNVERPAVQTLVKIDLGAPTVAITAPAPGAYLHTDAIAVSFSAADPLSGLAANPTATLDGIPVASGETIQPLSLPVGSHTVAVSAEDNAGNVSAAAISFQIVASIQSVTTAVNIYIAGGQIDAATRNSLMAKLQDAQNAYDRGNLTVVRNKLADFIDVCGKRLNAAVAAVLTADAQYVLDQL
jgi:hypothetical protein